MSNKTIKSRIVNKHDIEANWNTAEFIPKMGEIIIYDIDNTHTYERMKIGNGKSPPVDLPFVDDNVKSQIPTSLPANGGNACTVDGKHAEDFATAAEFKSLVGDKSVAEQVTAALTSAKEYTDEQIETLESGTVANATKAETATKADTATEADHAASATEADHATSADNATEAGHATSADSATTAGHATSADSATTADKATKDGKGNIIADTYETKTDATAKLTAAKTYTDGKIADWVGDKTVAAQIAASAYSLPTASSSTLGGVKTTSTVTSTSGLTACPIISGVPYYKDTNDTYTLSSFGITATAAELNYCDGVTSNIQTQLNNLVSSDNEILTACANLSTNKASKTHTHKKSEITDFPATLKNPNTITVQGNGTTAFTYDGSAAKTLNIKPGTNVSVSSDTSGNITINSSMPSHQHTGLVEGDYTAILTNYGNFRLSAKTTAAETGTIGTSDIPWRAGYFSEGVYSKGNRIPDIASGTAASTSVNSQSYTDVTIKFPFTFSAAPTVSLTLVSTSTAGQIGQISAAVYSVSTTQCVVRLFNGGSASRSPGFTWTAVGIKA